MTSLKHTAWKRKIIKIFLCLIMSALALVFLYPLFFLLINSLKDKVAYYKDPFILPQTVSFKHYESLIKNFGVFGYIKNTLIISVFSILLTLVCALTASYTFAKLKFKGKNIAYMSIICTMFIPAQVTMIPLYVLISKLKLLNTFTGVVLTTSAAMLPSTIMLLRSNFTSISDEMFEAARIDGANYFRIVWNILIPIGKPAIAISSIFNFLVVCNDLFRPMILLRGVEKRTLTVALAALSNQTTKGGDPTYMFAAMFVSALLPLVIYLIFSKQLVKGLTMGSIK